MKILIAGGHGFLGQHINRVLENDLSDHYEWINLSRRDGFDLRNLDVTKAFLIEHKPDVIIHCAADVGNINYVTEHAAEIIYNNVQMYLNLYKALSDLKLNTVVINTISNCTYPGDSNVQVEEEWWNGPIHDTVLSYGGGKKAGYLIATCNEIQHGIKTFNLILPNAYGPYDHLNEEKTHAMNGMVLRMIRAQRNKDKTFTVWGTGSPIREWIYMGDVARVVKSLLEKIKTGGEAFKSFPSVLNIGQEHGVSIKQSAELIAAALKADFEIVYDTTKRDGAPIKVLNGDKFKNLFPDFKFTPYGEGLVTTLKWYKNNIK